MLQNEYASILAKRVNEEKAKKTELRSKSALFESEEEKLMRKQSGERRR